jgi:hypothetical protein
VPSSVTVLGDPQGGRGGRQQRHPGRPGDAVVDRPVSRSGGDERADAEGQQPDRPADGGQRDQGAGQLPAAEFEGPTNSSHPSTTSAASSPMAWPGPGRSGRRRPQWSSPAAVVRLPGPGSGGPARGSRSSGAAGARCRDANPAAQGSWGVGGDDTGWADEWPLAEPMQTRSDIISDASAAECPMCRSLHQHPAAMPASNCGNSYLPP